jgi:hypothetical protein
MLLTGVVEEILLYEILPDILLNNKISRMYDTDHIINKVSYLVTNQLITNVLKREIGKLFILAKNDYQTPLQLVNE